MPEAFLSCIKRGGKVVTKTLKGGKYIRLCKINGKWFPGEVHQKGDVASALRDYAKKKRGAR